MNRTAIALMAALLLWILASWTQAQGSGSIPVQFTSQTVGASPISAPTSNTGERTISLNTPVGPINFRVSHIGSPSSSPQEASINDSFRPPALFSAPLPTGSGARALGLGGAFTAIADDATAASWNPAGLINLEEPEASIVFRTSFSKTSHTSTDPNYNVGTDRYDSSGINYISLAYPLYLEPIRKNMVLSLNIQEAYDFKNSFQAQSIETTQQHFTQSRSSSFSETQTDVFSFDSGRFDLELTSTFTTDAKTRLEQTIDSKIETDIDFNQEGVIDALTPAVAFEISPKFAVGAALNYYFDSTLPGQKIQSTTVSRYTMESTSRSTITQSQQTSGHYSLDGAFNSAGIPPAILPFSAALPTVSGDYPSFKDQNQKTRSETVFTDGLHIEKNSFEELEGFNATIGALWTVNNFLVLGASTDLSWTADAKQQKTIHHRSETYNADRSRLLSQTDTRSASTRDVTFHFPLFWSIGAALRWSPTFYTAIDISHTHWSDFAYEIEGEGKINPFNGQNHENNKLDDTWTLRIGTEYLKMTRKGEIPFRAGLMYEERPALNEPDQYYGFALGSGYALNLNNYRVIIDIAYHLLAGNSVQNAVPDQEELRSDVILQQLFFSGIIHF